MEPPTTPTALSPPMSVGSRIADPYAAGRLHDLANMIQVVSSSVRLLERHPAVQGVTALQPIFGDMLSRTERAGLLVRDLIQPDATPARAHTADAAKVIASVRRDLAPLLGRGIRLMARCEPQLPLLACPATSLEDALINLVFNARDAMPKGGLVLLRAKARRDARGIVCVELSVDDTGEGMSADVRERACEPYFSTKAGSGTGLGLTMVQLLADQASGSVAISSEPGRGTRVILTLPTAEKSLAA